MNKELTPAQIKRINNVLSGYAGSDGAIGRFWELYEEGLKLAKTDLNNYVSIDEYIEYLEEIKECEWL